METEHDSRRAISKWVRLTQACPCDALYPRSCPSPEMTPLVRPGIPGTSVTLFLMKYSSHVALRWGLSQKSLHRFVGTVTLSMMSVFKHLSKSWFFSVRFPSKQTLKRDGSNTRFWARTHTLFDMHHKVSSCIYSRVDGRANNEFIMNHTNTYIYSCYRYYFFHIKAMLAGQSHKTTKHQKPH